MFESAELGHRVDKETFEREAEKLRPMLLDVQGDLRELGKFPVLVLIGGVDGAGKGETVNLLNAWMDPRHIETRAFGAPTDEERARPPMWRFWRALPPKGKVGIFFGHWYTDPIVERTYRRMKSAVLEQRVEEINRFEEMLTNEGVLLLKFWFHLSKPAQKKRLESLAADPKTRWRVTPTDWERFARYDDFRRVSELVLRRTSPAHAPWIVVDGSDPEYRYLTVARTIHGTIRQRLDGASPVPPSPKVVSLTEPTAVPGEQNVLTKLEYDRALDKERYEVKLERFQGKLNLLTRKRRFRDRSLILVFEGADAAGKGGAIRRVTGALDARTYQTIPVAAPTQEERAQPYLWRFWRHVPGHGRVAIFDRSWYGRVLVERVEKFCSEVDWQRAYSEINDFEEQLVENGAVIVKFWLAITPDEQLRRFQEREKTEYKRFKITAEDWRNREKWGDYERAVCDMVERTSTELAPWTLVPATDKYHARITVLRTITRRLEEAL